MRSRFSSWVTSAIWMNKRIVSTFVPRLYPFPATVSECLLSCCGFASRVWEALVGALKAPKTEQLHRAMGHLIQRDSRGGFIGASMAGDFCRRNSSPGHQLRHFPEIHPGDWDETRSLLSIFMHFIEPFAMPFFVRTNPMQQSIYSCRFNILSLEFWMWE
jgi:hypothetical protein